MQALQKKHIETIILVITKQITPCTVLSYKQIRLYLINDGFAGQFLFSIYMIVSFLLVLGQMRTSQARANTVGWRTIACRTKNDLQGIYQLLFALCSDNAAAIYFKKKKNVQIVGFQKFCRLLEIIGLAKPEKFRLLYSHVLGKSPHEVGSRSCGAFNDIAMAGSAHAPQNSKN